MSQRRWFALGALTALTLSVGVSVARASLPADADALVYSGVLEQDGVLVNSEELAVRVEVYNVATAGAAGEALLCAGEDQAASVVSGRFRIALPDCPAPLRGAADAFVEVKVNGTTVGPRARVGAVPFALQAGEADTADVAASVADDGVTSAAILDGEVDQADAPFAPRLYVDDDGSGSVNAFVDNPRIFTRDVSETVNVATPQTTRTIDISAAAFTRAPVTVCNFVDTLPQLQAGFTAVCRAQSQNAVTVVLTRTDGGNIGNVSLRYTVVAIGN
jgi:hypothetical protein